MTGCSRLRSILAAIAATVVSGATVGCLSQPKESDFARLQDAFRAEGIVLVPTRKGDFADERRNELGCRLMDSKTENLTAVVCRNGVDAPPILKDLGASAQFRRFDDPRPLFKYLKENPGSRGFLFYVNKNVSVTYLGESLETVDALVRVLS